MMGPAAAGYPAALLGTGVVEFRLMGHTMVPLSQCYGGGRA